MACKKTFNFKLNDGVKLTLSEEHGHVVGRAHYVNSNPSYYVRYRDGLGIQREEWIAEDALIAYGEPSVDADAE